MRKILVAILTIAACICATSSYAGSIGNTIEPVGHLNFSVTAEGNFMFDRDMEPEGKNTTSGATLSSFEISNLYQQDVKLNMGILDFINVYAKLGNSKIGEAEWQLSNGQSFEAESNNGFLYGGGFNAIYKLGKNKKNFIGLQGDFSFFEVNVDDLKVAGATATNVSGDFENSEFQVGGFIGREMKFNKFNQDIAITPYLGVFWNSFNTETDDLKYTLSGTQNTITFDNESDDNVGVGVGADIDLLKNLVLNIEGRFITGTSVSVGGTYKF